MDAGLPIAVVARELGVPTSTLRSWQRRYGLGATRRSPGGHRRYTSEDLHRLRAAQRLIADGVTAAEAARVILAARTAETSARPDTREPTSLPARLLDPSDLPDQAEPSELRQAALDLDGPAVVSLLTSSLRRRGSTTTWERLVRPALQEVESNGRTEGYRIAGEHLLSNLVSAAFTAHVIRSLAGVAPRRRPVLLACAPDEQHTMPLLALAATLAEEHIHTAVLGARTPAPALIAATLARDPCAIVILAMSPQTAQTSILNLPIPPDVMIIAAGPGWTTTSLPPRVRNANGVTPVANLLRAVINDQY